MAGPTENDKQAIVAELAAARARLSAAGEALRHSLDVPTRAKESFQRHKPAWLSGAAIAGFVLSKLPSRKKTIIVERATGKVLGAAGKLGAIFSAAKFLTGFASPLVAELASGGIAELLKRFQRPAKNAPTGGPPRP